MPSAFAQSTQPGASQPSANASERLQALIADHHAWRMREFPDEAMSKGDYSNADKLTDASLAAIDRRHADTQRFLERARAIPVESLSEDDRLNRELFELQLATTVEGHAFRTFLAPIGGRSGPQQDIPQMHERVRFESADDYANYLARLEQTPRWLDDTADLLRIGLKEARTPPRVALAGVAEQFNSLTEGSGLDELAGPFERMPDAIPADVRQALRRRFKDESLPAVRAALRKLGTFVSSEYIPQCRTSIAASDWPDGAAWYAYALRTHSTTNMPAREIHELGLREVERIRAEMLGVTRRTDFFQVQPAASEYDDERLYRAFVEYLRTDPRFYYTSEDDLLRGYRDICKRIDAELPRLFRTLPRLPYGVRKIPDFMAPVQTTAYYSHGDIRNAEPGYFYANTYALNQRPRYEMTALALHEAVPGHHLQIALAQEQDDLPEFRRDAWFTAFGEGWALYAERLGIEVGLYQDPYDDFGRLLYEMWRACRLVVDPGMHALGWSRERAVQFMRDNTALSEININAEIDRYIAWPGQAVAYKIGELRIRALREKAEKALCERFDRRAFHDMLLSAGTLPLTVLESRTDAWIAGQLSSR